MDNNEKREITLSLNENTSLIENEFKDSQDVKTSYFTFKNKKAAAVFIETLINEEKLSKIIFERLPGVENNPDEVREVVSSSTVTTEKNIDKIVDKLLNAYVVIFSEESDQAICFSVSQDLTRQIQEPSNEMVIRGSHDGFTEGLHTNIHLLRRRIANKNLAVKYFKIGKKTNTNIAIVYMNEIANPSLVQEIEKRIRAIESDMIFNPGYMEEFLEDQPSSPFPEMLMTERPDRAMANILDGRVALLTADSPTALILPSGFFTFYQSPDDYNSRFIAGSFYRMIRMFAFFIAIFFPALYIATISYHLEVIPGELIIPIKSSIERIPYPPIIEALIMELTIELIREAGIRLPSPIGQTIGIVGGLVIGDAVVQAGLVSNITIIVVAGTAVASFVVPSPEMNTTVRMLRFPFMFAAASFGYIGISLCFILMVMNLCKLEPFGSPYFAPLAPLQLSGLKDSLIRFPDWKMSKRPKEVHPEQTTSQGTNREWDKNDSGE
jgi:spore germination protein KA